MGKYSPAPFKWRECLVCHKGIYGQKPAGSIDIFNTKGKKVGTEIYISGKTGYAHVVCKKEYMNGQVDR